VVDGFEVQVPGDPGAIAAEGLDIGADPLPGDVEGMVDNFCPKF
jgi:hypothetical protein